MQYSSKTIAGLVLFIGATLLVLAVIVSEGIDTVYTFSEPMNWLADGAAAPIFRSAFVIFGLSTIVGAYLIARPLRKQSFNDKLFWLLMTLTGIGAVGVGAFNENLGLVHVAAVRIFWVFAIPAAILSFKFQRKPFAYISILLGVLTLVAVVLFLASVYVGPSTFLGITRGGMQRMIQYPIMLWMLGFGAHLAATSSEPTQTAEA
ncbi:MAG TPA: DUF998 domain-containing protein [Candidatus Deferrimicrobiaceae bacterium]|jgi:hypothetical membrane protein|nr:DUF998 domain-containing protein [Candidatus Deferrimicrobiaceae bacterium]